MCFKYKAFWQVQAIALYLIIHPKIQLSTRQSEEFIDPDSTVTFGV